MNITSQKAFEYLEHISTVRNLDRKTVKAYKCDLSKLFEFLDSLPHQIVKYEIDEKTMKNYLVYLQQTYKPNTVQRKVIVLKDFFKYCLHGNEEAKNPFDDLSIRFPKQHILPVALTIKEIEQIMGIAYGRRELARKQNSKKYKFYARNVAIIETLFSTGIRVSELCQICETDLDLDTGITRVRGKRKRDRLVQISEGEPLSAIREYYSLFQKEISSSGFFFLNRFELAMSDQSVRAMVTNIARDAGIRKKVTPHTFRHSIATLLVEERVDIVLIQKLLGHSSILTTQIYLHNSQKKVMEILNSNHPRKQFTSVVPSTDN